MNNSIFPPIVVLGDVMLDEWLVGTATRISPEAPVPVLKFQERRISAGGAANVAANVRSLGLPARLCGLLGQDATGHELRAMLEANGVDASGLIVDDERTTTLKTRVVAGTQQVARVDRENDSPLSPDLCARLNTELQTRLQGASLLCASDYAKSVICDELLEHARNSAKEHNLLLAGGPKPRNLNSFRDFDFLSLNLSEASDAWGAPLRDDDAVAHAGETLRARLNARALVITRGGKGATLCEQGHDARHLRGYEVEVFDVAGAGDTFLAGACVALAKGATPEEAAQHGNLAAACSVRHTGVVAVKPEEMQKLKNGDA